MRHSKKISTAAREGTLSNCLSGNGLNRLLRRGEPTTQAEKCTLVTLELGGGKTESARGSEQTSGLQEILTGRHSQRPAQHTTPNKA